MPLLIELLGQQAANEIIAAVSQAGYAGRYDAWYVGITNDLDARFSSHCVPEGTPAFQLETSSREVAGSAEKHLLLLGFDGDTGGGKDARIVYVFLKWPAFARERARLHARQRLEALVRR